MIHLRFMMLPLLACNSALGCVDDPVNRHGRAEHGRVGSDARTSSRAALNVGPLEGQLESAPQRAQDDATIGTLHPRSLRVEGVSEILNNGVHVAEPCFRGYSDLGLQPRHGLDDRIVPAFDAAQRPIGLKVFLHHPTTFGLLGLRSGDVLRSVNGIYAVSGPAASQDIVDLLVNKQPTVIDIALQRFGEDRTMKIVVERVESQCTLF